MEILPSPVGAITSSRLHEVVVSLDKRHRHVVGALLLPCEVTAKATAAKVIVLVTNRVFEDDLHEASSYIRPRMVVGHTQNELLRHFWVCLHQVFDKEKLSVREDGSLWAIQSKFIIPL